MKIGIGYDVHKLVEGRELIIGGVLIPYDKGLLGHSDADVLIHAIIDALLGAVGLGDIGLLFPDTDNKFKDISSMDLLKEVGVLINNEGFCIGNIDSIIVAEKPKMRQYISNMEGNVSKVLMIDKKLVNIKATTEEGLGFIGKEEGISAKAICLLNYIKK